MRPRVNGHGSPLVMGILNVTPDSFSDGGRFFDPAAAVEQGIRLAQEGADALDIGGESTRPGSAPVPLEEEMRRVIPVIRRLTRAVRIPLSIDTSKAEVARQAIEAGASLVNDVTALRGDPDMARVLAASNASVILMHMQGAPRTMQRAPRYRNVIADVRAFLRDAVRRAESAGIPHGRIFIDPGLGFGKTVEHNVELLRGLDRFTALGYPVVLGPSRKSFIGALLNAEVEDRLFGTLGCVAHAAYCGIAMVRVHDVKPTADLLRMLEVVAQRAVAVERRRHFLRPASRGARSQDPPRESSHATRRQH